MSWVAPWYRLDDAAVAAELGAQLGREVAAGHVLAGVAVTAIGRRDDCDDVLFRLADGRVAEVHLTWRRSRETEAHWPATAVFASWEDWARARLGAG